MKWVFALWICLILATGCSRHEPVALRIMSYNIRHGEGMDHHVDLPRIAEVIRQVDPDIVALQEVDRGVERTQRIDEPAVLGRLTRMMSIFEKNIPYQGGDYGNAVLTRLPVLYHQNHFLPQSLPKEQRGMLEVGLSIANRPLVFFATHFDYHPAEQERLDSVRMFKTLAAPHENQPVILAGDLNSSPDSQTVQNLLSFMQDTFTSPGSQPFTFPADRPTSRIDYILFNRYPGLRSVDYRIVEEPMASDHRPIVATFSLANASAGGN